MRFLSLLVVVMLSIALRGHAATVTQQRVQTHTATPTVVLISIDGYRADYLTRGASPVLASLADHGVRAKWLIPSFPTVTEPNHYTFLTGLYPDRNGIVDNNIIDHAIQPEKFMMPVDSTMENPRWWSQATPLWVSVQRAGMRSAKVAWPSGRVRIDGMRPDYHFAETGPQWMKMAPRQEAAEVIHLLSLPENQRPRFIMAHFELVDATGHHYGPDSPRINGALRKVDAALGELVSALRRAGLYNRIDLVIVSDHGMAKIAPHHLIFLDDIAPRPGFEAVSLGAMASLNLPHTKAGTEAAAALLKPHPHMRCWRKQDMPARFHYGSNSRIPAMVCIATVGWYITTHSATPSNRPFTMRGTHGYDNTAPAMRALFVAEGPSFRRGLVVPPFPNVDIYALLAHILGVTPEKNDGDFATVAPMFKAAAH